MDLQLYPTPPELARRMWKKFKNTDFTRVLEPSAGNGDLATASPHNDRWYHGHRLAIDVCEIDISKHPALRGHGLNVVGIDFLQFQGGSIYSHYLLNPPFETGARHVLKAWDLAWNAEIVAIVNAESVRNPCTKERQRLVDLIEEFGEVEFISDAFMGPEVERQANVEIALIYLKRETARSTFVGDLLNELRSDHRDGEKLSEGFAEKREVALPNSEIENSVVAFRAAVQSMIDAVKSESRARYYASLLGETMAIRMGGGSSSRDASIEWVQSETGKRYDELKDAAWAGILRSSNVTSRLSSQAQTRVEAEFEQIKKLEFTVSNIHGFLCGIAESQGQIQLDMACDVFDAIVRYHTENTVFYRGWKSNDKHRTCGMRIKTTRFILPGHSTNSYAHNLNWDSERLLADVDKVFAMLAGKREPDYGLRDAFRNEFDALRNGKRVSSSYFDVRYYPKAGTIHFFANDAKLVDRLNRVVGRRRHWLPKEGERVSKEFWLQFDQAEKFDAEVRSEINKRSPSTWRNPLNKLFYSGSDEQAEALTAVDDAVTAVLERHGIRVDHQIEEKEPQQQLLLAA